MMSAHFYPDLDVPSRDVPSRGSMNMKFLQRVPILFRLVASAVLGVLAGLAWYRFVGCRSGGCPLTSNPWLMALFGGAMGLSLGWPDSRTQGRQGPGTPDDPKADGRDVL